MTTPTLPERVCGNCGRHHFFLSTPPGKAIVSCRGRNCFYAVEAPTMQEAFEAISRPPLEQAKTEAMIGLKTDLEMGK